MNASVYDRVLIAFAIGGVPPRGAELRVASRTYRFAPLSDGPIYTADWSVWPTADPASLRETSFCPGLSQIMSALAQARRDNGHFVMALTDRVEFDPPGSPGVHLPLERASRIVYEAAELRLVNAGYDVVDQWTGLSALVNLGYSADDLAALVKLNVRTNQNGLFESVGTAIRFAQFAAMAASEHAPFVPVNVFAHVPEKM